MTSDGASFSVISGLNSRKASILMRPNTSSTRSIETLASLALMDFTSGRREALLSSKPLLMETSGK
jgi:hypothetical protein